MAFGLPSKEEMRDYLISQGVPPQRADQAAADAAKSNAAQAARTAALSIAAGAAPARAGATLAREGITTASGAIPGMMSAVANAPRAAYNYLTVPRGVVRNPTTGARIPTRNTTTGRMERTPDYFLPGQNVAQGAIGAGAIGGASLLGSNIGDSAGNQLQYNESINRPEDADFYRSVGAAQLPSSSGIDRNEDENFYRSVGAARLPSSSGMDQADYPMRSPAVAAAKRAIPMPPTRPSDLPREEPGILSRIFSGKDYKSNSKPVTEDGTVNWGNPDSAADFFRADKARMAMEGRASGGSVNGKPEKDAALHKALEIIHHMIRSR